jgi:hypothetical protein
MPLLLLGLDAAGLPGLPEVLMTPPLESVRAYTTKARFATGHLPTTPLDEPSRPGDSVIALASYLDGNTVLQQWIIELRMEPVSAEGRAEPKRAIIQHTNLGGRYEFTASPSLLSLHTHGPFKPATTAGERIPIQDATVVVGTEFLGIGLHLSAEALHRVRRQTHTVDGAEGFSLDSAPTPFPPERVAAAKAIAERCDITPEQDRAFAMSTPALVEFFQAVQRTPGLSDILLRILEKPSLWSLVTKGGVSVNLQMSLTGTQPVDTLGTDLIYLLPVTLQLNGSAALQARLYVTAPRPPLRNTAGVFGIIAAPPPSEKPDAHLLVIRVVGGSR